MSDQIRSAIEKVLHLFSFDNIAVKDSEYKNSSEKVWCVVSGSEEGFLQHILETESLAPILVISTNKEKNIPLYLFKTLAEEFPNEGLRYIDFPFDIIKFIDAIVYLREKETKSPNPFKELRVKEGCLRTKLNSLFEKIDLNNIKDSDLFVEISKNAWDDDQERLKRFHGISSEEKSMQFFLSYQCCWEYLYAYFEGKDKEKKVLWIENNPDVIKKEAEILRSGFFDDIEFRSEEIEELYGKLQNDSNRDEYDKYDLVLIDMHLGTTQSGKDFLRVLSQKYPHIPAFIVSASEDQELISRTLKEGADYYILKKYAISIPHYFRKFHNRIGKIASLIENGQLRRNLIGNIRRWRLNKESIWFGDKCYHMINHSYNHAENDWQLMNQLFPVFYKKLSVTDEDIYCLSMATWLHDIGHSGNEQYGEPHNIRDAHSVISAELILKHPEHYGVYGFDEKNLSPYRYTAFRHPKTALQCIKERMSCFGVVKSLYKGNDIGEIQKNINENTILEKIALMCIYHSSKFPIDEEDVKKITKKRSLSLECYENLNRKTEPIHLASIASQMGDENILRATSILRFVDALDHNKNRVGDSTSRSIKIETIRRDLKYQMLKLESEVNLLINSSKISPEKAKRFKRLFFEDVERAIFERNHVPKNLKIEQGGFLDNFEGAVDTTNYELLVEYIQFICVQEGHFDLHNSIESIDVKTDLTDDGRFLLDIKFKTTKDEGELRDIRIKNWEEEKSKTLDAHLLGERNLDGSLVNKEGDFEWVGYIWKELLASKKYLKDILYMDDIQKHMIGIFNMSEKLISIPSGQVYGNEAAQKKYHKNDGI